MKNDNEADAAGFDEFDELLNRARKTPGYARLLCSQIANFLEVGYSLPESWQRFLIEALRQIADEKDPARALGVSKPHRSTKLHTDVQIAVDYWKTRDRTGRAKKAKMDVAEAWGLHPDNVEEKAKTFENEARRRIAFEAVLKRLSDEETDNSLREARKRLVGEFEHNRSKLIASHKTRKKGKKAR